MQSQPERLDEARRHIAVALETFDMKGATRDAAIARKELEALSQVMTTTGSVKH